MFLRNLNNKTKGGSYDPTDDFNFKKIDEKELE